jgi:hypothetical protein
MIGRKGKLLYIGVAVAAIYIAYYIICCNIGG